MAPMAEVQGLWVLIFWLLVARGANQLEEERCAKTAGRGWGAGYQVSESRDWFPVGSAQLYGEVFIT